MDSRRYKVIRVVNKAEFEQVTREDVVLVDFSATWRGPCKMLTSVLEEPTEDMKGKVEIVKVDVDQENDLTTKFGIMSVPTMIVFKNGGAAKQISGYQPETQPTNILNRLL